MNSVKTNSLLSRKTVYSTVVITGLVIGGISVKVEPTGVPSVLIAKENEPSSNSNFISSEIINSRYLKSFQTKIVEERDIIEVKEVIDMNLINKTLHEIKTMKNVGVIVGTLFGSFILTTPMYSNADWVTAVLASLIGFSIPILNVVERKFSR